MLHKENLMLSGKVWSVLPPRVLHGYVASESYITVYLCMENPDEIRELTGMVLFVETSITLLNPSDESTEVVHVAMGMPLEVMTDVGVIELYLQKANGMLAEEPSVLDAVYFADYDAKQMSADVGPLSLEIISSGSEVVC